MGTLTLSFREEPPRFVCYLIAGNGPPLVFGMIPASLVNDPETGLVERDMWVAQMRRAFAAEAKSLGLKPPEDGHWEQKDFGHPYKDPKDHMN